MRRPISLSLTIKKQLQLRVYDLVCASIFLALWAISAVPILTINLGFMRIGLTYVWPILLGLTLKPFWAFSLSIVGDSIALVISGTGFSQWMIEYALIYPLIALMTSFLKWLLMQKAPHLSLIICLALNALTFGALVGLLAWRESYVNLSRNQESFFDFSSVTAKAITWSMLALLASISVAAVLFSYFTRRTLNGRIARARLVIERYGRIYSIILLIIVVFVWAWGPFAQIRYLNTWVDASRNYYALYDLYLIPRVLKTPFSLAIYTVIVSALYRAYELVLKTRVSALRWTH